MFQTDIYSLAPRVEMRLYKIGNCHGL